MRRIVLKKIDELNNATGNIYQIRTENVRPDLYDGKYFLYLKASKWGDGLMQEPGEYGLLVASFKKQKDIIEAINKRLLCDINIF